MPRKIRLIAALLFALLLLPAAALAQEEQAAERPDPGFRVLGPRTVVSFVRQSLAPASTDPAPPEILPRWTTLLHVSNTGSGPLGAAAIFVSEDGHEVRAFRFPLRPGQTASFSVAQVIGDGLEGLPDVARGIVLLRFFAPVDAPDGLFFSQMVTAETIQELPNQPPQVIPLDVERPQTLFGLRHRTLRR